MKKLLAAIMAFALALTPIVASACDEDSRAYKTVAVVDNKANYCALYLQDHTGNWWQISGYEDNRPDGLYVEYSLLDREFDGGEICVMNSIPLYGDEAMDILFSLCVALDRE